MRNRRERYLDKKQALRFLEQATAQGCVDAHSTYLTLAAHGLLTCREAWAVFESDTLQPDFVLPSDAELRERERQQMLMALTHF